MGNGRGNAWVPGCGFSLFVFLFLVWLFACLRYRTVIPMDFGFAGALFGWIKWGEKEGMKGGNGGKVGIRMGVEHWPTKDGCVYEARNRSHVLALVGKNMHLMPSHPHVVWSVWMSNEIRVKGVPCLFRDGRVPLSGKENASVE